MIKAIIKSIKLNRQYWHKMPFSKLVVSDPLQVFSNDVIKFSEAMASFKFSGIYKSTRANRHKKTHLYLKKYIDNLNILPVILDIGASDGTTSLELIELVNGAFDKYYVTDYNIKCYYAVYKNFTYFFNQSNECFLAASKKLVIYPENKRLFNFLFNQNIKKLNSQPKKELLLCNHKLKLKADKNESIKIIAYNIFEQWDKEKADIVIIGNLLNPIYFSNDAIYKALFNCYYSMHDNGILVIIRNSMISDNKETEYAVVYKKNTFRKCYEQIFQINNEIEINQFILSLKF